MTELQGRALALLEKHGALTAEKLTALLDLTVDEAEELLDGLEANGLVDSGEEQ